MTDFDNRDLNGQQPGVDPSAFPTPDISQSAAPVSPAQDPFQTPQQPQAPQPEQPVYQQPVYGQQPQYGQQPYQQQPQYGQQQYQQPFNQNGFNQAQQVVTRYDVPPAGYIQKSRIAAGLLAIMLGVFGVHNFYLGFKTKAIIQLVVALAGSIFTCGLAAVAMEIWGLVEGIQILVANNPDRNYDANGVILRD